MPRFRPRRLPPRRRGAAFALRWLPLLPTVLVAALAGAWAMHRWHLAGGGDWMVNVSVTTELLPYGDDTRLLVVHVHTRNPSDVAIERRKPDDAFQVTVSTVPEDLAPGDRVGVGDDDQLASDDLLPDDGYRFIPRAEFDDTTAVVVPVGATYAVQAEITHGQDYVAASTLVAVPDLQGQVQGGAAGGDRARFRPPASRVRPAAPAGSASRAPAAPPSRRVS